MILLRSLLFTMGQVLATLVFAVLALLVAPFPFRIRYAVISRWARFNLWWLKWSCGLDYRVSGTEHIPPRNGIIFCKHQSAWETLALQCIFPPQVWVLKRELLWIPFFGWGLALLEPIAIDRSSPRRALRQLLEQGRQRLESGRWVVIFPEGTRVPPGEHAPFQSGGAVLAARTGYPVVPVAHNAGKYWPRRSFLKYPGTIEVVIGPPVETQGRTPQEINHEAEAWIRAQMERIG